MRSHEAGVLHAGGYGAAPQWLPYPADVNELLPQLWPATARRDEQGRLQIGGVDMVTLAREWGTAAYVLDEADFRARAASFRDDFAAPFADLGGLDVYYAGKAFLCTEVARWVRDEGLCLDVCSGGELAVAIRAGVPGERIGMHGNNKSRAEIEQALAYGVGRIVVDSLQEIDRVAEIASAAGVLAPVMVRVTVGVEAHTHAFIATAHEDQKFGFSLATGAALEAVQTILRHPESLDLRGLHSHIGSQIFTTDGFQVAAGRLIGLHARVADELGVHLPEMDLGGGFGICYTSQNTPLSTPELAQQMAELCRTELAAVTGGDEDVPTPRFSIEPGRAIVGPAGITLYEVGTVKNVAIDEQRHRTYVSVDGGMSDNARTALYEADYSCSIASRRSDAEPMIARVVGKHCEAGDIVVQDEYLPADLAPGDLVAVPGTGAYCRALSSQYNHTPRPPVIAVRDGHARAIVRRETIEDILALDVP